VARHVFIAGFEPFGGDKISPSEMVARSFEGRLIAGWSLGVCVLPVEKRNVRRLLEDALAREQPDVGVMRKGEAAVRGGADARLSNLPFNRIVEAWHANGVPGCVSNSAGTFIGNQALYEALGIAENAVPPAVCGLVQLPCLPAQAIASGCNSTPSMPLDLMKRGIEILVETVVPWVEQRTPEASRAREKGRPMWIPRGVKEVER
jgi:pyroglutamyl-peptidase